MTGYGRGVAEKGGRRAVVEIRSVNHRFMDVKLRGAPLDAALEDKVTSRIRERITRGSVTVAIRLDGGAAEGAVRADLDTARRVHGELHQLAAALDIESHVSLDLVCAQPGVLVPIDVDRGTAELVDDVAVLAVDQALDDLMTMRAAEGRALARDLVGRLDTLRGLGDELERQAKTAPEEAQRRLRDRLSRLLHSHKVAVDESRLAQEIAVLADRMDVTEELVRVRSHIAQVAELVAEAASSSGAVGRRLDFLVQELGREFNTVTSKSQSAPIARLVVEAKAELEKVREQVQNIE